MSDKTHADEQKDDAMSECTAPAYRAIFFDLDGTLLPMEIDEFMRTYFEALGAYVARFGVAPEAFMAGMKAGIKNMAAHDDGRPNSDAFWEALVRARRSPMRATGRRSSTASTKLNSVRSARAWCRTRRRRAPWTRSRPRAIRSCWPRCPCSPSAPCGGACEWAGVDSGKFSRLTNFANST